jgi:NTE family protein
MADAPLSGGESEIDAPEPGVGLCMSGGGYRATLFHVGALLRLNEAKIMRSLKRVSSVSGGSITAGVLGMNWRKLDFQIGTEYEGIAANLVEQLVAPIRRITSETIDKKSIIGGIILPGWSIADFVVDQYEKLLFGDATLQSLPSDSEGPRFVINATNVQTASLVRFSRPYLADFKVGLIRSPKISLATAVAASSAFPPLLSPLNLDVNPPDFELDPKAPLQTLPYTDTMVLSDGGVYDNMGLETVVKNFDTVLVSDAGAKIAPVPQPASNWAEHSMRILEIIDDQVRNLRKRALIDDYKSNRRKGAYWGIRSDFSHYGVASSLPINHDATLALASTPTRLKALDPTTQNRLMNWGYAVCDAALRAHAAHLLPAGFVAPARFPFPGGVG